MTTARPEDQRRLLDLQALDTKLDQIAHRRGALPQLARIAELDGQLADLDAAVVTSRTAVNDLRREVTKAESDVEQVRNRAGRDQARLDSGTGSPKDLQALQSELAALARRQDELEEIELAVMERLEAHEGALAELTTAQAALVTQRAEVVAERDAAFAELDAQAAEVRAERAEVVAPLEERLVTMYERLRGRLGGVAVAALRHGKSEGSGMALAANELARIKALPPEEIVLCEDSGRILVRGEDAF
ncbi:zinc ribbon domain-containing protein [Cellulomonas hominis]